MSEGRIPEKELYIPALRYLRDNPEGLKTVQLIKLLTDELKPTGEDAKILANREDTKFSQKVRNLTSHRALVGRGLAEYDDATRIIKITKKGIEHLDANEPIIDSLEASGFDRETIRKGIKKTYEDIILEDTVSEGLQSNVMRKHRERSKKLRDAKIAKVKAENRGKVSCEACGFDFSEKYDGHGTDYIEIHHLSPVHLMDVEGTEKKMAEALKSVVPLCSNCHRMIHRNRSHILTIKELKAIIVSATLA